MLGDKIVTLKLPPPLCVPSGTSVRQVIDTVQQRETGAVLICEGKRLVGIMTERDVLMKVLARDVSYQDPVDKFMTADPATLTTRDMFVPTCATCHMSGLEGMNVTHDTTERLSYWLFADISEKRPGYALGQAEMKEVCLKCHAATTIDEHYEEAEAVIASTNEKVVAAKKVVSDLRAEGLLTPAPFDEPIEFLEFDLWHYFGRTAKHGAFMGGADFVQWHGYYEMLSKMVELEHIAGELRREHEGG